MSNNEDLSKYLDQPTFEEDPIEVEYKSPEDEIREAAQPRTGLRHPYVKVGLWSFGVMVFLMIVTSIFSGGKTTTVTAKTPQDAKIEQLEAKLKQMGYKEQLATAQRQANKYTETVKPPADPKAKAKAEQQAAIAREMARRQQLMARSYQMPSRYPSSVPQAQAPARAMTISAPVASKKNDSEVLALRKELAEMQAKLTKQAEPPVEIASAEMPEDLGNQGYQPVAYQPPIDGGAEEIALMTGAAPVTIAAGSEVTARLDMGIIANAKGRAIATLSEPIKDSSGRVLIPKGSKLMGTSTSDGEVIEINLDKAIVNGQGVSLPGAGSIAVLKDNKEPLIAKSYGGNGFWGKFASAALGGVSSGVNQLISPDTSSIIGNGFSQVTSQSSGRSLGNAGLAALGGVSNGLSTGLQSEIQAGMQSGRTTLRGIKAGTRLRLVFLAPTPIVIPGFEPIQTAQLPLG